MSGWICLHRKLLSWEWYDDIPASRLFIHCMLKANHTEKKWKGNVIKRGSFITGRSVLADETGLTEQQIRTAITKLKSTNDLTIKATNRFSLVTVVNYGDYQDKDVKPTSKSTSKAQSKQPTDNQQITTTNNDNNDKQVNNKELVTDGFNHWWNLYPSPRRTAKAKCFDKFKARCKNLADDEIVNLINAISGDITKKVSEAEDIKFLPQTTTYLNNERWMDGQ